MAEEPNLNSTRSNWRSVAQLVEQDNDATLEENVTQLQETIGVKVSRATMGRVVCNLKLTRKKNSAFLVSEILNGCSSCECSIGMKLSK